MDIIKPRTLSGFMELLPGKQSQFERMLSVLRDTYASYGFAALDTPVIEDAQILLAKGGGETEKQIYRFQKGDSDLALRFDLTVPLAKYVALHCNELAFPFRRFQISKVYRGERAQRGRFREFYQADIDIIGDGKLDILNEAEIPAVIYKVFKGFGLNRFQIRVNNRKILNGFYAMQELAEKSGDIMRTVDKLDKIGGEKVKAILLDTCGLTDAQADEILKFISIKGTNAEVLAALEGYAGKNELFDAGLAELKAVTANLAAFGVPEENFAVDLTIARGLDYYTKTAFEFVTTKIGAQGTVCGGGRYDHLIEEVGGPPIPGVGFGLGIERLLLLMEANDAHFPEPDKLDVFIAVMGDAAKAYGLKLCRELRAKGLSAEMDTLARNIKNQFKYANRLNAKYTVVLGDNEMAEGVAAVKDMAAQEQHNVKFEDLYEVLSK